MTRYPTHYQTCTHPENFLCDFAGFYREADRRTSELRERGVRHEWHVPYGDHPSQIADVFYPPGASAMSPVFVFLHGGGFSEGHPDHYGFLAGPFIERGVIFVSAGYRLAPEASLEDSIDDGGALLAWISSEADALGIDRTRVFTGGHSAGAIIWASLATSVDWQAQHRLPTDVIAGAVLISGVYDFQQRQQLRSLPPLTPDDPLLFLEPLRAMGPSCAPLLIAAGSPELNRVGWPDDLFEMNAHSLHAAAAAKGVPTELIILSDLDHRMTAEVLGDRAGLLFPAAQRLIDGPRRRNQST